MYEFGIDATLRSAPACYPQGALDGINTGHLPSMPGEVDRKEAHAASEVDGVARRQGFRPLNQIAQRLPKPRVPTVPWREAKQIRKLEA
jgi:hypothetical protein